MRRIRIALALSTLLLVSICCAQQPSTSGPTNFAGSNSSQIVEVTQSGSGAGLGASAPNNAVVAVATAAGGTAVYGKATSSTGPTYGVVGQTESTSTAAAGVTGESLADSGLTIGVAGKAESPDGRGVWGLSLASSGGIGVEGIAYATMGGALGVLASTSSPDGVGVLAESHSTFTGTAVEGITEGTAGGAAGVFIARGGGGLILEGLAGSEGTTEFKVDANGNGFYAGNLYVDGTLTKHGGSFKIDDPLDPENKYLSHSFVESPDMMNIYNGTARLNARGEVWVTMPDYFQALNRDFQYVLTALGRPQPNLYIAMKMKGNRFKIAGGKPNAEVSWQVTGIRQDAWANAHRIPVEEDKPEKERGTYLSPELFGASSDKGLNARLQH